jgi:thioredoxin 1
VDEDSDLGVEYGIRNIPTLLFFKDGQMVDKHVGTITHDALTAKIDSLL